MNKSENITKDIRRINQFSNEETTTSSIEVVNCML